MSSPVCQAPAGATSETALYLRSGTQAVFAVLTAPAVSPADLGVVLAHSGASNFSAHRNGVWTALSRRLAGAGIRSLRFDFAGTGDSSGEFVLGLAGQPVADVTAAMDALRAAGCRRLLVIGSCFGALPGVVASAARGDVAGVILLSPPLVLPGPGRMASIRERAGEVAGPAALRLVAANRQYRRWYFARLASLARARTAAQLRRLAAPIRSRAAPGRGPEPAAVAGPVPGLLLESELARLVSTGRHVEVVFGTSDRNLARVDGDPQAARAIRLLRDQPAGLSWTVIEGPVHGLEDVAVQEQLIQLLLRRGHDLMRSAT